MKTARFSAEIEKRMVFMKENRKLLKGVLKDIRQI